MPATVDVDALEAQRQQLFRQLTTLGDLRPGSLTASYRKCGKPTCRCADASSRGHGPHWQLTAKVNGKTRTRTIPAAALAATRAQIAECQRLRRWIWELIEVSEGLCDARLQSQRRAATQDGPDEGKKSVVGGIR